MAGSVGTCVIGICTNGLFKTRSYDQASKSCLSGSLSLYPSFTLMVPYAHTPRLSGGGAFFLR